MIPRCSRVKWGMRHYDENATSCAPDTARGYSELLAEAGSSPFSTRCAVFGSCETIPSCPPHPTRILNSPAASSVRICRARMCVSGSSAHAPGEMHGPGPTSTWQSRRLPLCPGCSGRKSRLAPCGSSCQTRSASCNWAIALTSRDRSIGLTVMAGLSSRLAGNVKDECPISNY